MMGLEFMWGGMLFNLIEIIVFLALFYICVKMMCIVWKNYDLEKFPEKDVRSLKRTFGWGVVLMIILAILSFGSAGPKRTIESTINRSQIEYDHNTEEVEIITPPPRVEFLDGFESLFEE